MEGRDNIECRGRWKRCGIIVGRRHFRKAVEDLDSARDEL